MIPRPSNIDDNGEGRPEWFKLGMEKGHDSKGFLVDPAKYDDLVLDYCRTLMAVDDSIGRVLSALEETGELDNTVIVFAGDNGYFLGEHGRLDKRTMNKESIRIPLLIRYPPLIRAGSLVEGMALNVDIGPTFLDLAGVPIPKDMHGRSLRPAIQGRPWRKEFLYEYFQGIPNNRSNSFPSSSVLAVVTITMFIPFTLSILS
jgi:arylsulfatase A-like enzyme